jgi:hypothetical protein
MSSLGGYCEQGLVFGNGLNSIQPFLTYRFQYFVKPPLASVTAWHRAGMLSIRSLSSSSVTVISYASRTVQRGWIYVRSLPFGKSG